MASDAVERFWQQRFATELERSMEKMPIIQEFPPGDENSPDKFSACPDCGERIRTDYDYGWKRHFEYCEPHLARLESEGKVGHQVTASGYVYPRCVVETCDERVSTNMDGRTVIVSMALTESGFGVFDDRDTFKFCRKHLRRWVEMNQNFVATGQGTVFPV